MPPKPICPYDGKCYRQNPQHFIDMSHPTQSGKPLGKDTAEDEGPPSPSATKKRTRDDAEATDIPGATGSPIPSPSLSLAGAGKKFTKPKCLDCTAFGPSDWTDHKGSVCMLNALDEAELGKVGPRPIAAFDMDDTLIYPKSGAVFPSGSGDWQWLVGETVPSKLRQLHKDGFRILIVSNQEGASDKKKEKGASKEMEIKVKINALNKALGVPISALFACEDDVFRKPLPTMMELFAEYMLCPGQSIDMGQSFYIGDAAGRKVTTLAGRKKDHSCSDRKFAYNVGIAFKTPEEFFATSADAAAAAAKAPFEWGGCGPADLAALKGNHYTRSDYASDTKEMVLMCGFPGSGKSTFFRRFLEPKGYVWVNRDTLKTPEKCLKAAQAALATGKSVCIDNTNPSADVRKSFIDVATKAGVEARLFFMDVSKEMAGHMNAVRAQLGLAEKVPRIAYNMYQSKFWQPDAKAEGLKEVVKIPLVPDFDGLPPDTKRLFYQLA